jgi:hypothetical protein
MSIKSEMEGWYQPAESIVIMFDECYEYRAFALGLIYAPEKMGWCQMICVSAPAERHFVPMKDGILYLLTSRFTMQLILLNLSSASVSFCLVPNMPASH